MTTPDRFLESLRTYVRPATARTARKTARSIASKRRQREASPFGPREDTPAGEAQREQEMRIRSGVMEAEHEQEQRIRERVRQAGMESVEKYIPRPERIRQAEQERQASYEKLIRSDARLLASSLRGTDYDEIAYFNPLTAPVEGDQKHEKAWLAFLNDMTGGAYLNADGTPVSGYTHKVARKLGVIGPGNVQPPRGRELTMQSIRHMNVRCHPRTRFYGYGPRPKVFSIDACSYGWFTGGAWVDGVQTEHGSRLDIPDDVFQQYKSIQDHAAPQMSFTEIEVNVGGVWKEVGFRGGSKDWNFVQEDHYHIRRMFVYGDFSAYTDVMNGGSGLVDRCKYSTVSGYKNWSNNRRHLFNYLAIAGTRDGPYALRTGVVIDYVVLDGVVDMFIFGGTMAGAFVIKSGEAETCARLVRDDAWFPHDMGMTIRDFTGKCDLWTPNLFSPASGQKRTKLSTNALGTWASGGELYLDRVKLTHIPVARDGNGRLFYAPGGLPENRTTIPAPRIWLLNVPSNVITESCSFSGYRCGPGYNQAFMRDARQGDTPTVRHQNWRNTRPSDGVEELPVVWAAVNQRWKQSEAEAADEVVAA